MLDGTKMTASLRSKFVIIDQLQLVITLHKLQTETDNNRKYHSSQACVIQKGRVRVNLKYCWLTGCPPRSEKCILADKIKYC